MVRVKKKNTEIPIKRRTLRYEENKETNSGCKRFVINYKSGILESTTAWYNVFFVYFFVFFPVSNSYSFFFLPLRATIKKGCWNFFFFRYVENDKSFLRIVTQNILFTFFPSFCPFASSACDIEMCCQYRCDIRNFV